MYFFFSKVLQELLWPLNWTFAGLVAAFFLIRRGRETQAGRLLAAVFVLLYLFSTPLVGNALRRKLESAVPTRPIAAYPAAEAIVVLGGSVAPVIEPRYEPEELNGSRLLPVARLFKAGKAKLVVTSSGFRYKGLGGKERVDAEDMKEILVQMGVPAEVILTEAQSRTTKENAEATAKLLHSRNVHSILLVTSAFHVMRATGWFKGESLDVTPVPVALEAPDAVLSFGSLWPTAAALSTSTLSIEELVGHLVNPR